MKGLKLFIKFQFPFLNSETQNKEKIICYLKKENKKNSPPDMHANIHLVRWKCVIDVQLLYTKCFQQEYILDQLTCTLNHTSPQGEIVKFVFFFYIKNLVS